MIELFSDEENGGLFFTGSDGEPLPTRPKEIYDAAIPSGNSAAALNLQRLALMTGDTGLEKQAEAQLQTFAGTVSGSPSSCTFYLCALDFALAEPLEIVIVGEQGATDTNAMLQVLRETYLPVAALLLKPPGEDKERQMFLASYASQEQVAGMATAYVCRSRSCQAPVTDPEALRRLV